MFMTDEISQIKQREGMPHGYAELEMKGGGIAYEQDWRQPLHFQASCLRRSQSGSDHLLEVL
jgi:hypothetical protein